MNKLELFFEQLIPFVLLGIAIAFTVGLIIVFSYVLMWGILLGGIIWIVFIIHHYFSSRSSGKRDGSIIEHNDNND